jgi:hypothetical protein
MDTKSQKYKDAIDAVTKKHEQAITTKVRNFLGEDGLGFFKEMVEEHGEVSPVFMKGGLPHAVHFREGMQVRNFLRSIEECDGWTTDDFDDTWATIVEDAIK